MDSIPFDFFFQAEDGIRDLTVTGVQTCALPISDLRPCVDRTKIWDEERPRVKAEYEQRMQDWREAAEKAKAEGARAPSEPRVPDALRESRIAASLYDRMIAPLIPYAIRGVVW